MEGVSAMALVALLVFCVAALDALEYQFEATRVVHLRHNFPDVLGYRGKPPGRCLGSLMAATSGALCCTPALLALPPLLVLGVPTWAPMALLSAALLVAALVLALAALSVRGAHGPLYGPHRAMYVLFGLVLVVAILDAARSWTIGPVAKRLTAFGAAL
jgi:hypothetical protein